MSDSMELHNRNNGRTQEVWDVSFWHCWDRRKMDQEAASINVFVSTNMPINQDTD
jgi:hypothetical protein